MFRTPQNQMIRSSSTADLGNLGDENADDPHSGLLPNQLSIPVNNDNLPNDSGSRDSR